MNVVALEHELELAGAFERWLYALAFTREARRRTKLKRLVDCGHWIDGGEPYRYCVWKVNSDATISQRSDCEFCARDGR